MRINIFKSRTEAYLTAERIIDTDWDTISQKLVQFNQVPTKEDAQMFNLWEFLPMGSAEEGRKYKYDPISKKSIKTEWTLIPNTVRRCANNVVGLWGMVLDYDGTKSIIDACQDVDGLEYVCYTSFRHTPEHNKFRIVLPFSRMMTHAEFIDKEDDMRACFPFVDPASFSMSQAIYFHSGPSLLNKEHISFINHGHLISPDDFKSVKKPVAIQQPTKNNLYSQFNTFSPSVLLMRQAAIKSSLRTCKGIRRGVSSGNGGGLTLAVICKSFGLSFSDFQSICMTAADADSSMRDSAVQQAVWDDVSTDRITRDVRDAFIQRYGGTPFQTNYTKLKAPVTPTKPQTIRK